MEDDSCRPADASSHRGRGKPPLTTKLDYNCMPSDPDRSGQPIRCYPRPATVCDNRDEAYKRRMSVPTGATAGAGPITSGVFRHDFQTAVLPDAGGYVACFLGCGSASPFSPAVLGCAGAWRSWVTVGVPAWRGCSDSSSESSSGFSTACLP